MIKKSLVLLLIVVVFFSIFKFGIFSYAPVLYFSNMIKTSFMSAKDGILGVVYLHFDQADSLEKLKAENEELKKKAVLLNGFANEVIELGSLIKYKEEYEPFLRPIRAISYAKLPYFQKVWLDFHDYNSSKIYGLLYNNVTAGIVTSSENGSPLGILNGDPKCSYAVYVGEKKAPGVAMGKNDKEMVVKYIPSWMSVEAGEEVTTSGLDEIFFAGIKVGVVTDVKVVHAYKEATVEPYYNSLNPRYFYVIEKTK